MCEEHFIQFNTSTTTKIKITDYLIYEAYNIGVPFASFNNDNAFVIFIS